VWFSQPAAQCPARALRFADVVDRIKPAVIPNVACPGEATAPAPEDNPLDQFFRRFPLDDDSTVPRGQIARALPISSRRKTLPTLTKIPQNDSRAFDSYT
jgi:hypothetical protein